MTRSQSDLRATGGDQKGPDGEDQPVSGPQAPEAVLQVAKRGDRIRVPSNVYRILKAQGLINERETESYDSPDNQRNAPRLPNEEWHTDITYVKVSGRWAEQVQVSFLVGCSLTIMHVNTRKGVVFSFFLRCLFAVRPAGQPGV